MSEGDSHPTTKPIFSKPFNGEYVDVSQLRNSNEAGKYVNQGNARISTNGEILESEGFSKCSALIVQNQKTKEAYLAHISEWNLTDKQYDVLNKLSKGDYLITLVTGSLSRVDSSTLLTNRSLTNFMESLERKGRIAINEDIIIDSGNYHWAVSYDPKDKKVKVFTQKDHVVREYPLEA